ncbi:MAG: hypothetical protein AB8F78_16180 [Saprospiraceae bacterium]
MKIQMIKTGLAFCCFVSLLFLSACDHDTDTFDGPSLVNRFGEFMLVEPLTLSTRTVDFSAGEEVSFGASFNKEVEWLVEIKGLESGSIKIVDGFSNELDDVNSIWDGGASTLPLFKLERCAIELIIPSADSLRFYDTVEVTGLKAYEGSLFTDFEEDLGTNLVFGNFEFEFTNQTGRRDNLPEGAGQGDWAYYFEGTDANVPNFFVGLVDISAQVTGETYIPLPTTDPEDVFFNAFLYTDGGPFGIAVVQFIFDSNDSGAFEDGQDQTFQLPGDFPLSGTGWQHISHSMSETGITETQLEKLVGIRILLISDMNSQPSPPLQVDYGIDFLTFTQGGPLEL